MTMEITLKEALVGFSRTVKQLDGRDIIVEETGVTGPYSTKVIKVIYSFLPFFLSPSLLLTSDPAQGEGMPIHGFPSETGDLKIQMKVRNWLLVA